MKVFPYRLLVVVATLCSLSGSAGAATRVESASVSAPGQGEPIRLGALSAPDKRSELPVNASQRAAHDDGARPLLDIMGSIMVMVLAGMLAMLVVQRRLKKEIALRRVVEERLTRSNDLLERTGRMAKVGGWEFDFVNDRLTWTDEAARIRELPPGSVATHEQAMSFYAPEERPFFIATREAAIRDGTPWEHESLLSTLSGRKVWVHARGEAVRRDGKTVLISGVLQDITDRKLAEIALARTNSLLQTIIDTSPLRIFWKDRDLRYIGGNPMFVADAGLERVDDLLGKDDFQMVWREFAEKYRADDRKVMETRRPSLFFEEQRTAPAGQTMWVRTSKIPLLDEGGGLLGVLGFYEDISDEKLAGLALLRRTSELEMHNRILRQINQGFPLLETLVFLVRQIEALHPQMLCAVLLVGDDGKHLYPAAGPSLPDVHAQTVTGMPIAEGVCASGTAACRGERVIVGDVRQHPYFAAHQAAACEVGMVACWSQPIIDHEGRILGVFAIYQRLPALPDDDEIVLLETYANLAGLVIERHRSEEQIRSLAFYDTLTRLPNRRMLADRLALAMAVSKRSGRCGALMFLDLDNFKPLNDRHGHAVGDLLLIQAAQRISSCVREIDTVARFGGDEFVIMLSELEVDRAASAKQAGLVAEKIRGVMAEPYFLTPKAGGRADETVEHRCTASIGVALFVNHETTLDNIVKWADAAMYQAKNDGRNAIRFHD